MLLQVAAAAAQNRKKKSSEFDINSFVIPYSIASSVRPEKLEYKEIPTPDWRECPVMGMTQLNGFGVHVEVKILMGYYYPFDDAI